MIGLDVVTTLCVGLLIGTELAVSVFINPVLQRLDEVAQPQVIRLFAHRLGSAMPFWYAGSLLLLAAAAVMRRHENGETLLITACVIWAAVIVHSVLVLVPIANRMGRLNSESFTADARREHRKWDRLHRVRVAALTAAAVCFLIAVRI